MTVTVRSTINRVLPVVDDPRSNEAATLRDLGTTLERQNLDRAEVDLALRYAAQIVFDRRLGEAQRALGLGDQETRRVREQLAAALAILRRAG